MKNLKSLLGKASDSSNLTASLVNLQAVKGHYVGSGFDIVMHDLSGRAIAKFQIRGEEFDKVIDQISLGIGESLKLRKYLVAAELKDITEAINNLPEN